MSNLETTPTNLEGNTQIYKNKPEILASIGIAMSRVNLPISNMDSLANDVLNEFKGIDIKLITEAIKKGSLGMYGRTYRMSTQEVCIWVREYLKTNKVSSTEWEQNPYKNS